MYFSLLHNNFHQSNQTKLNSIQVEKVLLVAVVRLHDGDLHTVGWSEGP